MHINIEYDKEINQVFLRNGNRTFQINRTEIATVEKIFDAMDIPYTEKLGEVFIFDKEIAEEENQSLLDKLKAERGVEEYGKR